MFHLNTHLTHLQLYGVEHIVKDHSDNGRGYLHFIGNPSRLAARGRL